MSGAYIPEELAEIIYEVARARGKTTSGFVTFLLRDYLHNHPEQERETILRVRARKRK